MFDNFLGEFYKGMIALFIGIVFVVISLIKVKRKDRFEEKYHVFFWIGLLFIIIGFWFFFQL